MNKKTAIIYDALLQQMSSNANIAYTKELLVEFTVAAGIDFNDTSVALATFLADGFITPIKHPGAPEHDFGIYTVTQKGIRFVAHEGGYRKKQKKEMYSHQNLKFTWVRHWVWFFAFILSVLLNLYLLLFGA